MTLVAPRARRIIALSLAIVTVVLLAGATYQGVTTALERRRFPRPGGLVDVGGHQLHIHCTGSGEPLVILEAPATGMSAAWGWVQPDVARVTRVCSYDRAGLGWSEAGDRPYDAARVPEELHTLLENAGVRGPFVLTGHGLGAAFVRMFAARYPAETRALVLIDPPWEATMASEQLETTTTVALSPWLARAGILRVTGTLARRADGLPAASGGAMRAFLNRPDHLTRTVHELRGWSTATHLAAKSDIRPGIPVSRVTVARDDTTALLADREASARVARAIGAAVEHARGGR
jgi:pimeloyl-ACP methyl ester carboxylesterase